MAKNTRKIKKPRFNAPQSWGSFLNAIGVENNEKEKQAILFSRKLDMLAKITKAINSEKTVKATLKLILKSAIRLTNSDCGVVFFKKGGRLESVASINLRIEDRDKIIRPWRGIVGHVLSTKKFYLCNNTDIDKYFVEWGSGKEVRSEMSVPIIINRRVVALLIVSTKNYNQYSEVDIQAIKRLAENATIAIRRAQDMRKLRDLKSFSENVINSSSLGMVVADRYGRVVQFNKASKKLYSKSILKIGRKVEFPLSVKLPTIEKIISRLKQDKIPLVFDSVYHYHNRHAIYFNLRIDPLFDERGGLESILLTKENITERVLLEKRIRKLNKSLELRVKTRTKKLDLLNEKLQDSMESRMQFLADVSHELKTPLTVIQGNTELLLRSKKKLPKDIQMLLGDITKETKAISDRLESMIGLIHEKAEGEKIEMKTFRTDILLEEISEQARSIARHKKVQIIMQKNPKIALLADRKKIKELIMNLVTNAIKYNQVGGKVWINAKKRKRRLEIYIKDTGIGITKEDLPYIFDRYYRAHEIERYKKARGSGIGLAVSRWIAKAHGGEIKVRSKVGKGSHFTLELPLSQ